MTIQEYLTQALQRAEQSAARARETPATAGPVDRRVAELLVEFNEREAERLRKRLADMERAPAAAND